MISSVILLCAFDRYYITNILNNTNQFLLAHGVGAYGTNIGISNIMTSLQNLISFRILMMASPKLPTVASFCFNKCSTNRKAVFLPMPGSFANSLTAFSTSEEENCMVQS